MKLAAIGNEYWMVDDASGDPLFYVGPAQAPAPTPPPPPPQNPQEPWYRRRMLQGLGQAIGWNWPSGEGLGQWLDRRALALPATPTEITPNWWQRAGANVAQARTEQEARRALEQQQWEENYRNSIWGTASRNNLIGPTIADLYGPVAAGAEPGGYLGPSGLEGWQAENRARVGLPSTVLPPYSDAYAPTGTAGIVPTQTWDWAAPGAGAYAPESDVYGGVYPTAFRPEAQVPPRTTPGSTGGATTGAAAAQAWPKDWANPPPGYRLPEPGRPGQYRSQAETETWWQAFRAQHKGVDPITFYASNPLNIRPGANYQPTFSPSGSETAALQSAEEDWDWAQGILARNIRMGIGAVGPSTGEWEDHWYQARGRPTPREEGGWGGNWEADAARQAQAEAERRAREAALPYTSTRWDRW